MTIVKRMCWYFFSLLNNIDNENVNGNDGVFWQGAFIYGETIWNQVRRGRMDFLRHHYHHQYIEYDQDHDHYHDHDLLIYSIIIITQISGNEISQIFFIFFFPLLAKIRRRSLWTSVAIRVFQIIKVSQII